MLSDSDRLLEPQVEVEEGGELRVGSLADRVEPDRSAPARGIGKTGVGYVHGVGDVVAFTGCEGGSEVEVKGKLVEPLELDQPFGVDELPDLAAAAAAAHRIQVFVFTPEVCRVEIARIAKMLFLVLQREGAVEHPAVGESLVEPEVDAHAIVLKIGPACP